MKPTKLETAASLTLPTPHEPGGTSNIEHPTPNIEWQRDSSLTSVFGVRCWMFDVFPRFTGFNVRIFISGNPLRIGWGKGGPAVAGSGEGKTERSHWMGISVT